MDPIEIKRWLQTNLADASRAPQKVTKNKRVLQPYMGFNANDMVVTIYRDVSTKEYYADIVGKEVGPFPATTTYNELLTSISESYVQNRFQGTR